jgi:uncharacterized repeat protein (TIGR03803 family)
MRQNYVCIAASCILAAGLLPILSFGAAAASNEKVIYSFTGGTDGQTPYSDLTIDGAGDLYGTTLSGGGTTACNFGCGTVFELKRSIDGWKEQVLYRFTGGSDGGNPSGGVIFDKAGNLYGTTVGTVFKLTPNSHGGWTESTIYTFPQDGSVGFSPDTDLIFDAQGNLYGATTGGGASSCLGGCGAVFELVPQSDGSWTEITVHRFSGGEDGGIPSSGLVLDSLGNVYGTTVVGGSGCKSIGCGIVYKFTPHSGGVWTETIIFKFFRGGGAAVNNLLGIASSRLMLDQGGHMIGTTTAGGNGLGTIFELVDLTNRGWEEGVLYRFYGDPDGEGPEGNLVTDAKGTLFGVTRLGGGVRASGTVFEFRPSGNPPRERVLHSFRSTSDGAFPEAGLVSDSQGHLYGTTQAGGGTRCRGGCGVVYEITP